MTRFTMPQPEFDNYSASYENLLKDPLRDSFGGGSSFFHERKRDLIRDYFLKSNLDTHRLRYLDAGCGKGDLMSLLANDFAEVSGCDPSSAMLDSPNFLNGDLKVRVQDDPGRIPWDDAQFDFVTAVCVYHHVPLAARAALTAEVRRVLRPGGVFAIIEHNPFNPATRLIVSRTPVDADAILLRPRQTQSLLQGAGFAIDRKCYFLYLPEKLYGAAARLENLLERVPLGGQYAVFGRLPGPRDTRGTR
jgi:SAM-dependent methyltransferase